jgi:antirestriction protein ArdC
MVQIERAKEALQKLLHMFESGNLPAAITRTLIKGKPGFERPCEKWSLGNRLLMMLAGTEDARGFKQWQDVGRHVSKGAKAIYILAPQTKKVAQDETDPETGEQREVEHRIIIGFRDVPVFRFDDTEGAPLPEEAEYAPPEPPPLQEVAKAFGVESISYAPAGDGTYGFYSWRGGKRIVLHTLDVKTWFHELGHAVHHSFRNLRGGQVADQEIVADVFAATLCDMYGFNGYQGHIWNYVKSYAGTSDTKQALKAIFKVLADVEECLKRAFEAAEKTERGAAA